MDLIIHDYETLIDIIKKQEKEKDELSDEILRLKQDLRNANINVEIAKASDKTVSNVDLLKRISNLEKVIYGKDDEE